MLVLIFLLGRAVDGKVFSVLAKSMLSAGFGFLLVVGIMEYGGYGCLIILAGVFEEFKRWANLELDAAKKLGIPVILVEAADPKHTSHKEKRAAAEIVKWDAMQLGDAIVRHARLRKPS